MTGHCPDTPYTAPVIAPNGPNGLLLAPLLALLGAQGCLKRTATRSTPTQSSVNRCTPLRADGTNPVIDNFESDPRKLPHNEGREGWWFNFDDGTGGHLRRESVELREVKGRVLHVTSSGYVKWGSGLGVSLHPRSTQTRICPYDGSVYDGLRFRARGRGRLRVSLADQAGMPLNQGGTCNRPRDRCYDHPGVWANLVADWKTFEFPFCTFFPEGWGSSGEGADPSKLIGINFRFQEQEDVEFWLDDLEFYNAEPGAPQPHCGRPCPLEGVPHTARMEPLFLMGAPAPGLSLHTFEQSTLGCGSITRRYLTYVPKRLEPRSQAPVLIMLHGSGANAEIARTFQTHERFDALAERDGFIVVYGNAAPGIHSSPDPSFPNTGAWRQTYFDDGRVDDVKYLEQVIADLTTSGTIAGTNTIFLAGISNGGGMVLEAARQLPERFRGAAVFMPFDGERPKPVPATHLKRLLFAYATYDPGLAEGYHVTLAREPATWAKAMGIPAAAVADPKRRLLPDRVAEGANYAGSSKHATATRDSYVTQSDILAPDGITQLRVLVLEHAGHFWPNPVGDTEEWVLNQWGLRNQDFDAADMVWEFMKPVSTAH